jgi:hypothetical protein
MEHRLRLTTITGLLAVITTLSLCEQRSLAGLVFWQCLAWRKRCMYAGAGLLTGDLVLGMLLAILALAVGSSSLGNIDLGHVC